MADKIRAKLKKGGEKIAKAISDDIITDETMAYYATLVIINSSDGKKHLYDAVTIKENHGIISAKTCQKKLFVFGCVDNGYAICRFAQSNDLS